MRATAYGCGRLGADLVAESPELALGLLIHCALESTQLVLAAVCIHGDSGQPVQGFSADTETTHEVLGSLKVNLFAKYLLVAGYLRMAFTLPGVAESVRLDDISVILKQDIKLQNLKETDKFEDTKPKRILLWSMREDEKGINLAIDKEFSISRQMALADDDNLRPSTHPLTDTGIRVSHTLQVIIRITPQSPHKSNDMKEIMISHQCIITSCECLIGNLQLPPYSKQDPIVQKKQKDGKAHVVECLCRASAKEAKVKMEQLYGEDPATLGGSVHFGSGGRVRDGQWKSEEQYRDHLETSLRASSPVIIPNERRLHTNAPIPQQSYSRNAGMRLSVSSGKSSES